jgi:hypothetical protein
VSDIDKRKWITIFVLDVFNADANYKLYVSENNVHRNTFRVVNKPI